MCNIAGYAGNRRAAPILLEMLRRQEYYDGNMSTGIATIHEGKLYYRKLVGDVDNLIKNTDVLDLPGTIGIAHTRPSGGDTAYQPCISADGTSALATNGTHIHTPYDEQQNEAVRLLLDKGYTFRQILSTKGKTPHLPNDGNQIFPLEVRLALIELYLNEGRAFTEALALSCSHMYADNATVVISEQQPDSIFAMRTTRPLLILQEPGESRISTSRYAFDAGKEDLAEYLALHQACEITRSGLRISKDRIHVEPVSEITPETFRRGYDHICKLLSVSREDALYFDDLELDILKHVQSIFAGGHPLAEHARLVYDVLWQLKKEGRLRQELRPQVNKYGTRQRWFMWLEN